VPYERGDAEIQPFCLTKSTHGADKSGNMHNSQEKVTTQGGYGVWYRNSMRVTTKFAELAVALRLVSR